MCLSQTSCGWQMIANRAMLSPDVGPLQTDLVGARHLFRPRAKLEAEILALRQRSMANERSSCSSRKASSMWRARVSGRYPKGPWLVAT